MSASDAALQAPIPRASEDAPVFAEPWEAQVFALVVALHERGLFTWTEWAEALGAALREAQPPDGSNAEIGYYEGWLLAIERLTAEKRVTSLPDLSARRGAWERAARATPHGEPILLANDPGA